MAYKVEVTEIAAAEIDSAYLWLRERSSAAAERWYRGPMASLATLRHNPRRCVRIPSTRSGGMEIRQLIYGRRHRRYRILFTISENAVAILRVRHSARAPIDD